MPFVLNLLRETPTKAKCAARESNPGRKNGNLTCYHYTSGADADARIYRFITVHRKSYSSLRVDDGWNRWCGYWVKEKQIIAYFITCFKLPPSFVFFLTHWNDSTIKMYSSLRTRVRTLWEKLNFLKVWFSYFLFPPMWTPEVLMLAVNFFDDWLLSFMLHKRHQSQYFSCPAPFVRLVSLPCFFRTSFTSWSNILISLAWLNLSVSQLR